MFAHHAADDTAVGSVAVRTHVFISNHVFLSGHVFPSGRARALIAIVVAALVLTGCMPGVPLAGADPADPSAKVAGTGYRSTVAPYSSLRPSVPAPWREQNDRVAPPAKSGE